MAVAVMDSSGAPPAHPKGSLVLHLAARGLGGGGSWDGTAENWVVYTPDEAKELVTQAGLASARWGGDEDSAGDGLGDALVEQVG